MVVTHTVQYGSLHDTSINMMDQGTKIALTSLGYMLMNFVLQAWSISGP